MADYIEREAAIAAIMNVYVKTAGYKARERVLEAKEAVSELPAADAMPVRHGLWRNHYRSGVTVSEGTVSSCFIDDQMAAWARNDLIGMLADAGHALVQTGLKVNGARYQDVLVGPLMVKAAAALEECWKREGLIQAEAKPDKPGDVVVKVTVPDRWPMTEAGQRWAAQEAAADVAPVVHGEWEAADWREYDANSCEVICYPKDGIACTHCRYVFKKDALWKKNFCPNCGAKMDGGAENG